MFEKFYIFEVVLIVLGNNVVYVFNRDIICDFGGFLIVVKIFNIWDFIVKEKVLIVLNNLSVNVEN